MKTIRANRKRGIPICSLHPDYKANSQPRRDCPGCWNGFERGKLAQRQTLRAKGKTSERRGKCAVCGRDNVAIVKGLTRCIPCETVFTAIDMHYSSISGIRVDMVNVGIPVNAQSEVSMSTFIKHQE